MTEKTLNRDAVTREGVDEARKSREPFASHWWRFRPIQGALLSGLLLGLGFGTPTNQT